MATTIPIEVELIVKNTKNKLEGMMGGGSGGSGGGAKKDTGMGAFFTQGLKALIQLATIVSVISIAAMGMKRSIAILSRIAEIISLILRPFDLVIGVMLMSLLRLLMPLVRTINTMFRPFYRRIIESQKNAAKSGSGFDNAVFFAVVVEEFGKFLLLASHQIVTQMSQMFSNIIFALAEILVSVSIALQIATLRAIGLGTAADAMSGQFAMTVGFIDLIRQGINILTEKSFNDMVAALSQTNDAALSGGGGFRDLDTSVTGAGGAATDAVTALDPFTEMLQTTLVSAISVVDKKFSEDLSNAFDVANDGADGLSAVLQGKLDLSIWAASTAGGVATVQFNTMKDIFKDLHPVAGLTNLHLGTLPLLLSQLNEKLGSTASAIRNILSAAKSVGDYVMGGVGVLTGHQKGTNSIPQTGPYLLHKGEAVVPAGGGGGSGVNVNITINGSVLGSDKELATTIGNEMRKQLRTMTSYSRGA